VRSINTDTTIRERVVKIAGVEGRGGAGSPSTEIERGDRVSYEYGEMHSNTLFTSLAAVVVLSRTQFTNASKGKLNNKWAAKRLSQPPQLSVNSSIR